MALVGERKKEAESEAAPESTRRKRIRFQVFRRAKMQFPSCFISLIPAGPSPFAHFFLLHHFQPTEPHRPHRAQHRMLRQAPVLALTVTRKAGPQNVKCGVRAKGHSSCCCRWLPVVKGLEADRGRSKHYCFAEAGGLAQAQSKNARDTGANDLEERENQTPQHIFCRE